MLLLHRCATSWESSSIAPEATLTLSKDNKLGCVIRSKLVLRLIH